MTAEIDEDGVEIADYDVTVGAEELRAMRAENKLLRAALDNMLFWLDELSQQVEASDPAAFREDYNTAAALIDKEVGEDKMQAKQAQGGLPQRIADVKVAVSNQSSATRANLAGRFKVS